MAWDTNAFLTIEDLYLAYRKAKVDMYYERDHATAFSFVEFEESLDENLANLFAELNASQPSWQNSDQFVGGYGYVPKSLDPTKQDPNSEKDADTNSASEWPQSAFVVSDPDSAWAYANRHSKHAASFRIVGRHPVAFHVVSALWIQKVGYLYDRVLRDSVYGSRIRGTAGGERSKRLPNATSLGSFRPYTYGFRAWRQDGLKAIRNALDAQKSVIAITADLRRFYHSVGPAYLLRDSFLTAFDIQLSPDQRRFTSQLITALKTWAKGTPEHSLEPHIGLPVGISAPRVIANSVLAAFDKAVEAELGPIFYGRYVDDVLLVLENREHLTSPDEIWGSISKQLGGLVRVTTEEGEFAAKLELPYANDSKLRFAGSKQKIFLLSGTSGKSLLDSITKTVEERSSDWRMLPDLPTEESDLANDFVSASDDATEEADNLRKSDGLTIRRLAFAIRLRNFESVQQDLLPVQWQTHRERFYTIAMDHVLTVPGLFAYGPYLSRLVGLAVACGDFDRAIAIVKRIGKLFDSMETEAKIEDLEKISRSRHSILSSCLEAIPKSIDPDQVDMHVLGRLLACFDLEFELAAFSPRSLCEMARRLQATDLAREPFRKQWIDGEIEQTHRLPRSSSISIQSPAVKALHLGDASDVLMQVGLQKRNWIARAIIFPTRPFTPSEIALLDQNLLFDADRFRRVVKAIRGSDIRLDGLPTSGRGQGGANSELAFPNSQMPSSPLIAVPCFETFDESWMACVSRMPDPDATRYFRLNRLINDVLREKPRPDYLVLHELSMPRRWFQRIAHKLSHSGVSLVAGLEYRHYDAKLTSKVVPGSITGLVSNEVGASLVTDVLGYRTHLTYLQEKARPALDEERLLKDVAGKLLAPRREPRYPIIRHGDMYFGILICSELTNIELRAKFRGKVDALFVPEWNQDTNTFKSLVEASALDIHCYVVQVNNRAFGDCRIRAPYREPHRRDIGRVSGGESDYYFIGKLDVSELRAFQSNFRSPKDGLFKPTPDGFERSLSGARRILPAV